MWPFAKPKDRQPKDNTVTQAQALVDTIIDLGEPGTAFAYLGKRMAIKRCAYVNIDVASLSMNVRLGINPRYKRYDMEAEYFDDHGILHTTTFSPDVIKSGALKRCDPNPPSTK